MNCLPIRLVWAHLTNALVPKTTTNEIGARFTLDRLEWVKNKYNKIHFRVSICRQSHVLIKQAWMFVEVENWAAILLISSKFWLGQNFAKTEAKKIITNTAFHLNTLVMRVQRVKIKVFKKPLFHAVLSWICYLWSVDTIPLSNSAGDPGGIGLSRVHREGSCFRNLLTRFTTLLFECQRGLLQQQLCP